MKSILAAQVGGLSLRVFEAKVFSVSDITVVGTLPMAMVAVRDLLLVITDLHVHSARAVAASRGSV